MIKLIVISLFVSIAISTAILPIKHMYEHCGPDTAWANDFPFQVAFSEVFEFLYNISVDNELFYPAEPLSQVDRQYLKFILQSFGQYAKGLEKGIVDLATINAEKIYARHFEDVFLLVIGNKDKAKTVLKVQNEFVKLSKQTFQIRSRDIGSLAKLHEKAVGLIFDDCAKNSDCELPSV